MDTCVRHRIQDHQTRNPRIQRCSSNIISKRHLYLLFTCNNSYCNSNSSSSNLIISNSINTIIAHVAITIISKIIIITMEDHITIMHNS